MRRAIAIVALLSITPSAIAAPPAPMAAADDAARLKKEGDTAMLESRYEDALDAYAASYALTPNPALHYNRARALEALGRYADALTSYESFAEQAPPDLRAKVPQLDEHVAGVRKRVTALTVRVRVPVKGARVTLRGRMLGPAPLAQSIRVDAGKARLEVSADGYRPYDKEIELPGGGALTVDVELVELVERSVDGIIQIDGDPAATASVDGKALGTTPVEARLAAGTHTITLSRSGYATRTSTVVIASGERKHVALTLEAESGIASRWWFWASVGVVAAGGAVLTISLMTSRDPGRGDIAPGRVSAPLVRF